MRVVIAGAGPVGLMVACELRLHGIETVVLERLTEIDPRAKAGAIQGRGVEALERRGLGDRLRDAGGEQLKQVLELLRTRGVRGHFAGMWLLRESNYGDERMLPVSQQALEAVLAERAAELGVEVRRGHVLQSWKQDADGVTLTLRGPASARPGEQNPATDSTDPDSTDPDSTDPDSTDPDPDSADPASHSAFDHTYTLHADWLIGADGGRSTVRKSGSFAFPGTDGVITGYQAVAELDDPDFAPRGWNRTGTGFAVNGPTPGRLLLVEFDGPPADRDAPVTVDELQAALRRVSGTDVTVRSVSSVTRFTDNARQADTYREGRVLLAGDAAHVHSPFGGQGLNLGLGDAFNLGWKLALVALGRAPESLLDTYTAERHPVAERVLDNTRAQVALMQPGPHTDALRGIFAKLLDQDDANRWLTDLMGGNDLRYDLGAKADAVGRFCPDLVVTTADGGEVRLAELQRSGRGQLLVFNADEHWGRTASPWSDRVDVTYGTCDAAPATALLVRPDGFTAWTTESDPEEPLTDALTRWFGPAS